jgi:hypothetical protein
LSVAAPGSAFLLGQVGADVFHVLVREHGGHAQHDGVVAFAAFVFAQLLDQVLGMLLGQHRVFRQHGFTSFAVAGDAHAAVGFLAFGQVCSGGGESGCCHNGSGQQGGKQLHSK